MGRDGSGGEGWGGMIVEEWWGGVRVVERGGEGWEWRRGVGRVRVEERGGEGWEWRRGLGRGESG